MSESDPGKVSVIVPARNEEANLERVLCSLAGQQSVREILVVDDNSRDRTAEIARALKEEIPRLRILRVDSLPEGWLGKSYAVALAAREAAGDWLLFTDADTEHLPGSLAATLEIAEREGADLLSLSPGQITPTWWEKAVIPLVYVHLARLYRFEDVSDPESPAAAANGQYLLIRRAMYERIGGHEAIRNQVLEDVELAKRVKTAGGKLIFLPGAEWVQTRMYRTFGEMWRGWTKNLFLLYGQSLAKIFRTMGGLCLSNLLPVLWLLGSAILLFSRPQYIQICGWLPLLPLGALLIGLVQSAVYYRAVKRLGFLSNVVAWRSAGETILIALLINSVIAYRISHHVEWKGRRYSTGSSV
jgi:glycosyltransferase involved in cell wall biosynthesis